MSLSTEPAFVTAPLPLLRDERHERASELAALRGHAAGYAAGLRAGQAEIAERRAELEAEFAAQRDRADRRVEATLALLRAAARALEARTVPHLVEAHDTLAAAAVELAEAVIRRELADTEASAVAALRRALEGIDTGTVLTVRMHPDDLAELGAERLERSGVPFSPDPSLPRGDAVTEFPDGFLDARIGTALERVRAALAGGAA